MANKRSNKLKAKQFKAGNKAIETRWADPETGEWIDGDVEGGAEAYEEVVGRGSSTGS